MKRPNDTQKNTNQMKLEYKNTLKCSIAEYFRDQLILQSMT